MLRHRIAVLSLIGLLNACATAPTTPDWVGGTSQKYPASNYLIGRGQGNSAEQARDQARADLAKVFEVKLAATSEDVQTFKGGTGETGEYRTQTARTVTARTEQIVRGINIAEQWQDPASASHHALAVLARLPAAAGLRQEINDLDAATRRYVERARTSEQLAAKIQAASNAVEAQQARDGLQRPLRVVDPTGRGVEAEFNLSSLRADLTALLKRLRLNARTPGEAPAGFEKSVQGATAAAGFDVTSATPDYVLEGALLLNDIGLIDGFYWQRGTLELTLKDAGSGTVQGSQRWPLKASARDRATAQSRAVDEANKILQNDLRATVLGFLAAKPK
jgi:hypothetical protein